MEIDSPAYDAGFEPGCFVTSVDGQPVRDIIDWRWLTGEECITVGYIDLDGEEGEVELWREPGEDWGFEFQGLVFDGVRQCRNACTFCFMRQLPPAMRPSLSLRDDDYRLSFLVGTFVTLTNLKAEEEARIIEQRISPLRVSLQVSNAEIRRRIIGKHAQHGIDALDRLLDAGIQFHAQIVLVPGQNDGQALVDTLQWAYERPGFLGIGIVPLGYTRHQDMFTHSFNDPQASREVLDLVEPFQQRALEERGTPWVYAADEFYRNAYADELLDRLPSADFYGDFSMFEDGIGIIRSTVDDWRQAQDRGLVSACASALREAGMRAVMIAGFAQREFLDPLVKGAGIGDCFAPLYVRNGFFGGNVDVTGLLVGADMAAAIKAMQSGEAAYYGNPAGDGEVGSAAGHACSLALARTDDGACDPPPLRNRPETCVAASPSPVGLPNDAAGVLFLVPRVVFNDGGLTLDDMTLADMEKAAGAPLHMVSCSPADYFNEIIAIVAGRHRP